VTDVARTRARRPPHLTHWCVHWCVCPPLLPGQGGDELAAEVGDVGDDAAPHRV
jgi:hypothetical protein